MANVFPGLARSAIAVASKTSSQQQAILLEKTKILSQSTVQLLRDVQEAGGNPKAVEAHHKVEKSADVVHEAIKDLTTTTEQFDEFTSSWVTDMLEDVAKAVVKADDLSNIRIEKTYVGYRNLMLQSCQIIDKRSSELVSVELT